MAICKPALPGVFFASHYFIFAVSFIATEHARSPTTLRQVAPISHSVLILMYTPMTPVGSPAIVASAANDAIAPPGTPGVPILSSVFDNNTIASIPKFISTPQAFAKNTIIKDIRIDTASILIVAPSGIVTE